MKVLLLAHRAPWPLADGYNLHVHHLARELAARHELHLVTVGDGPLPAQAAAPFVSVAVLPPWRPQPRSLARRLVEAWSADQLYEVQPEVLAAARRVVAERDVDVVWAAGAKTLVYSRRLPGPPVLADLIDDETREPLHDLRAARSPRSWLRGLRDALLVPRFLDRHLAHVGAVSVVAEPDAERLARRCPGRTVGVLRHGVESDRFAPGGAEEDPDLLVFEGVMGHPPNSEAAILLAREVLPRVRARRPATRLVLVGRDPPPEVVALAGAAVEVTGFVDDVRPYLDRAALFVCPLARGSGVKNKLLQAWAMGTAVVATPRSLAGLDAEPGVNVAVAEQPAALAQAVLELLEDPGRRAALASAGRRTVVEKASWSASAASLEQLLETARADHPARPAGD